MKYDQGFAWVHAWTWQLWETDFRVGVNPLSWVFGIVLSPLAVVLAIGPVQIALLLRERT